MGNPSNWISELKKGGFGLFEFFFEKSWIFSEKTEFFFYLYFLSRNVPKVIRDIISKYFYHTSPLKRVKKAKCGISDDFSDFWSLSLEANFEL